MTRNFSKEELECPCCKACNMHPVLLTRLQALRDEFGKPLKINSGFRCRKQNNSLPNSSKNSQHLLGKAVDISTIGMTAEEKHILLNLVFSFGFRGIGVYKSFIHIDTRVKKSRW